MTLPLFPLRLVLFPGQVLPLHVFEPRYRMMINQCVEEEQPFGVVLMREDTPDWRDVQRRRGVALRGRHHGPHPPDGAAGRRPAEHHHAGPAPLPRAQAALRHALPARRGGGVSSGRRPTPQDARAVSRLLQSYIKQLSQVLNSEIDLGEMPEDPHALAFVTASALQLPWDEKQSLLETPDLPELLSVERTLLGKETMMLGFMHASESRVEEQVLGPTGYLYPN